MPIIEDLRAVLKFEREWMAYRIRKLNLHLQDPGRPEYYFKEMQTYQLIWNHRLPSIPLPVLPILLSLDYFPPRADPSDPITSRTRVKMPVSIPFCIYGNHPRLSSMTTIGPGAGLVAEYEDICPVLVRLWEWSPVRDRHGLLVLPPMDQPAPLISFISYPTHVTLPLSSQTQIVLDRSQKLFYSNRTILSELVRRSSFLDCRRRPT
ncbi:hypothetical protein BT69DRAFT_778082 [Atractiella rhizophila]|nr:hypothetical protein BT69DRAFT_778082 [Atractiella rhizophila]